MILIIKKMSLILYRSQKEDLYCRVTKLADVPSCLGGDDKG